MTNVRLTDPENGLLLHSMHTSVITSRRTVLSVNVCTTRAPCIDGQSQKKERILSGKCTTLQDSTYTNTIVTVFHQQRGPGGCGVGYMPDDTDDRQRG